MIDCVPIAEARPRESLMARPDRVLVTGTPDPPAWSGVTPVPAGLAALMRLVRTEPETEAALLLVDADRTRGDRTADLLRAAGSGDHLAVIAEPPPMSRSLLLAAAVQEVSDRVPLGVVLGVLPELRAAVATRVLLSSVARLEEPNPAVSQHLRGWWPGTRFLTDLTSVGSVTELEPATTVVEPAVLLHAADPRSAGWAAELADSAAISPDAIEVSQDVGWGCSSWAELSAWTRPPGQVLADALAELDVAGCAWCLRDVVVGRSCPFCSELAHDPKTPARRAG
jgi:hypothetical protein